MIFVSHLQDQQDARCRGAGSFGTGCAAAARRVSPQPWGLLLLFTDSKSDKVNVLKFPQFPRFQALN